jgi:fused signal recognition particle receptor
MPLFSWLRRGPEDQRRLTDSVAKTREGWLGRVASLFRQGEVGQAFWDELEERLLAADVGVPTTQRLLEALRRRARQEGWAQANQLLEALKAEMVSVLSAPSGSALLTADDGDLPKPLVLLVVGVNGVGKTTSIAKLAARLKAQGRSVLLGAGDTFRAAGIEQLQVWAQRVGVEVISHQAGSDPAGVAFDTVSAARSRGADVVILDTAGRLHTKQNLMEEMRKVSRVVGRLVEGAPHEVLLVLDGTTGQNGLAQARSFTEAIGCTGVFLAKMDGTARGGIVLAICHELGLPVLFVGTGEGLQDVAPFAPEEFVEALFAAPFPAPR